MSDLHTGSEIIKNNLTEVELEPSKISDEIPCQVITFLRDLGCCTLCILRYLDINGYDNMDTTFLQSEKKLLLLESKKDSEYSNKRSKRNVCISCLDILDGRMIERYLDNMSLEELNQYNFRNFKMELSLPKCIPLRERSIFIYLKRNFPDFPLQFSSITNIKKVFRIVANDVIFRKFDKSPSSDAYFIFKFLIEYTNDNEELKDIKDNTYNFIDNLIANYSDEEFKKVFPVPVDIPSGTTDAKITCSSDPLYFGGRYLKFVRNIGQTPWIINNRLITETCVEDIIFDGINKVLGRNYKMTFSASGREDADVRMLGKGRPFYIVLENPRMPDVTYEQFRAIEELILNSEKVAVINLKKVNFCDLKIVKHGEEKKSKRYSAICHTTIPHIDVAISIINNYSDKSLVLEQTTPLRVLHRRNLDVRMKTIFSMKACRVPGHSDLLQLDLETEAGTYVKEFVNSDFNRTRPSIAHLIRYPIDIVALDVTDIDLEWPV